MFLYFVVPFRCDFRVTLSAIFPQFLVSPIDSKMHPSFADQLPMDPHSRPNEGFRRSGHEGPASLSRSHSVASEGLPSLQRKSIMSREFGKNVVLGFGVPQFLVSQRASLKPPPRLGSIVVLAQVRVSACFVVVICCSCIMFLRPLSRMFSFLDLFCLRCKTNCQNGP